MTKTFAPNEMPTCPSCNKALDEGPARDYVVWYPSGMVSPAVQESDCGYCDAMLRVTPVGSGADLKIVFKTY